MNPLKAPIRVFKKKAEGQADYPASAPQVGAAAAVPDATPAPGAPAEPVWTERRKLVREIPEPDVDESFRESTWAMFELDKDGKS